MQTQNVFGSVVIVEELSNKPWTCFPSLIEGSSPKYSTWMVDGRAKLAKLGLVVLYFKGETKKVSIDEEIGSTQYLNPF